MRLLFPDASRRSPTTANPLYDAMVAMVSVSWALPVLERVKTLLESQVLLPDADALECHGVVPHQVEASITALAIHCEGTPTAAQRVEILVGGKVQTSQSLLYLAALWPQPHKLKIPVLMAKNDVVEVLSSLPCTAVLIAVMKSDVR